MRYLNFIIYCLVFLGISCKSQGLILLTPYKRVIQEDGSRIYKKLGLFFTSDTSSVTTGCAIDNKVTLKLSNRAFYEVFNDSFLVASINPKIQLETSRPKWTLPRSEMYILGANENCRRLFYCKLDTITIRDNLKEVARINKQYDIEYDLISINLVTKELWLQKIVDKATVKIPLVELPIPEIKN